MVFIKKKSRLTRSKVESHWHEVCKDDSRTIRVSHGFMMSHESSTRKFAE